MDGDSCWLTLLVNVMTSTLPGSVPSCTMRATRAVTTRVLPLKAGTGGGGEAEEGRRSKWSYGIGRTSQPRAGLRHKPRPRYTWRDHLQQPQHLQSAQHHFPTYCASHLPGPALTRTEGLLHSTAPCCSSFSVARYALIRPDTSAGSADCCCCCWGGGGGADDGGLSRRPFPTLAAGGEGSGSAPSPASAAAACSAVPLRLRSALILHTHPGSGHAPRSCPCANGRGCSRGSMVGRCGSCLGNADAIGTRRAPSIRRGMMQWPACIVSCMYAPYLRRALSP